MADLRSLQPAVLSAAACCWMRKKTSLRPRRLALRRGRRATAQPGVRRLREGLRRLPGKARTSPRPTTAGRSGIWSAGLVGRVRVGGARRSIGWDMTATMALASALGVGIDALVAAELLPELEAVVVRRPTNRSLSDRRGRVQSLDLLDQRHARQTLEMRVAGQQVAPRRRAVAKMMASAVASLWARQASAAASAISVSSGTT